MCERLAEIKVAMVAVAEAFDPAAAGEGGAAVALAEAAAIEHIAATLKARAAAWLAQGGRWRRDGMRSPADDLARQVGTSVGAARDALELGGQLAVCPQLAAAAARGEVSPAQARVIAGAAAIDPSAEASLLAGAQRQSLSELIEEAGRIRAAADPDPEARRRRIHAARRLRSWTDVEGAWHLGAVGNPEDGARLMAALEPLKDRAFRAARAEGRPEPVEAYAFDALMALTEAPTAAGRRSVPAKVIARVDLDALLRGYPSGGETCELAGYGPVAVSAVRDLIDTGDPFLAAVATKGEAVVGVAHLGRRPTACQRTALEWLYPTCAAEGCAARARLEIDHRVDWAASRATVFDLLDRLCGHHHVLKTRYGWALVEGRGKRPFVAPTDPRHPRHGNGSGTGPP